MYFVLCVTKCAAYLGQDPLVNEILYSWLNKGLKIHNNNTFLPDNFISEVILFSLSILVAP